MACCHPLLFVFSGLLVLLSAAPFCYHFFCSISVVTQPRRLQTSTADSRATADSRPTADVLQHLYNSVVGQQPARPPPVLHSSDSSSALFPRFSPIKTSITTSSAETTESFHAAQAALTEYLNPSVESPLPTAASSTLLSPSTRESPPAVGVITKTETTTGTDVITVSELSGSTINSTTTTHEGGQEVLSGFAASHPTTTTADISSQQTDLAAAHRPTPIDSLRGTYPNCPLECEADWTGDLWCDKECNISQCGYDAGDCKDWCRSECPPLWMGDGHCDLDCYTEECKWDNGDCKHLQDKGYKALTLSTSSRGSFDYSNCTCDRKLLGNGSCDAECNTYECNKDMLDCTEKCNKSCVTLWQGDGICDQQCDTPECFHDKGDCKGCDALDKCRGWMPANTVCDMQCNAAECDHDGGDCIGMLDILGVDYNSQPYIFEFCANEFLGDGHCDIQCFSEKGQWDGGDCAGADIEKLMDTLVFPLTGREGGEEPMMSAGRLLLSSVAVLSEQKEKMVTYRRKLMQQNTKRKYRADVAAQLRFTDITDEGKKMT
eukprot:GHVS01014735.1.p1 GENE.GHVS01014735.1~~GHVS01014735.1.p1  ORF type:complete len:548 (+),score=101.24 GHVS01014735.1:252-1895(+)